MKLSSRGYVKAILTAHKKHKRWQTMVCIMAVCVIGITAVAMTLPASTATIGQLGEAGASEENTQTDSASATDTENQQDNKVSDANADVEQSADWEKTIPTDLKGESWADDLIRVAKSQTGYQASENNFALAKDGETHYGYTRYGQWYGEPYGDETGSWDAAFAAFCLHYANVSGIPCDGNVSEWVKLLRETDAEAVNESKMDETPVQLFHEKQTYQPQAGDIVFFDTNQDASADHCGILTDVKSEEGTYQLIAPARGTIVEQTEYQQDDATIIGYLQLPNKAASKTSQQAASASNTLTAKGDDYVVTASYGDDTGIPENAELRVKEYTKDEKTYEEVIQEAITEEGNQTSFTNVNAQSEITFARSFDITFIADDKEIEPNAAVDVSITCTNVDNSEGAVYHVIHHAEDGIKRMDAETEQTNQDMEFRFSSNSFSVYDVIVMSDTETIASTRSDSSHPPSVETGTISTSDISFYNIAQATVDGESKVAGLADCQYQIYQNGSPVGDPITTTSSIEVAVPTLNNGTYTIKQVAVPQGWMRNQEERTFTVTSNGASIGIFYNYPKADAVTADKTAEVVDENNRTYRVDLTATSQMKSFTTDPINAVLVVDQSNSMLFPSALEDTGKTVTLLSGVKTQNNTRMNALGLDTSQVYYIVTDAKGTSTMYALWYDSASGG